MTELDSLLQAILRDPSEDLPRLVFADWLDDHADAMPDPAARARAEFIRCQIAVVRCPRCNGTNSLPVDGLRARMECSECAELRRREEELFKIAGKGRWFDTWEDEFGPCPRFYYALPHLPERIPNIPVLTIARGFPARYRGPWGPWQAHADVLLADPWVPGLDEVELTTWPEEILQHAERDRLGLLKHWYPAVRSWALPPEPRANPDPLPNGFFADLFSQEPAT